MCCTDWSFLCIMFKYILFPFFACEMSFNPYITKKCCCGKSKKPVSMTLGVRFITGKKKQWQHLSWILICSFKKHFFVLIHRKCIFLSSPTVKNEYEMISM